MFVVGASQPGGQIGYGVRALTIDAPSPAATHGLRTLLKETKVKLAADPMYELWEALLRHAGWSSVHSSLDSSKHVFVHMWFEQM